MSNIRHVLGRLSIAAKLTPTMAQLWAIAALVAVFVAVALSHIEIADFWWHLRLGEVIATSRRIPSADSFSFTATGMPFVYQQWLGELVLYGLFQLGGLESVALANALLLTGTAAIVMLTAYERSRDLRVAALCTALAMFAGLSNRDVRPQSIAFLLFALCLLVLARHERGASPLWILPLLGAVWANVHGSVALGLVLCTLAAAGSAIEGRFGNGRSGSRGSSLWGWSAAFAGATILNPWGVGLVSYVLAIGSNRVVQAAVTEWAPPTIRDVENMPLFVLLLGCAGLFALSGRPLKVAQALTFITFAALALQAERNSIWFAMVAAPLAAAQTCALRERLAHRYSDEHQSRISVEGRRTAVRRGETIANSAFGLLLVGIALASLPWVKPHIPMPPRWQNLVAQETPAAAVRFVANTYPEERMFHSDGYGSYMIWASPNKPSVFVDTRVELYPVEVWQDYIQISRAQDWEDRLAKYGVRHVLLPKQPLRDLQRPLLRALEGAQNWELVYDDERAVVYEKRVR